MNIQHHTSDPAKQSAVNIFRQIASLKESTSVKTRVSNVLDEEASDAAAELRNRPGGDHIQREDARRSSRQAVAKFFGSAERWTNAALGLAYLLGVVTTVIVAAAVYVLYRGLTPSAEPILFQSFAGSPNGEISVAESGQAWIESTNGAPNAGLRVIDGRLTNDSAFPGPAVGYISADLPTAVSRVAAEFGFSSGTTDNGSAAIMVGVAAPRADTAGSDLTSPCHLVITPTKMDFGVSNNGRVANVGSAQFSERLAVDTAYNISIEIDYIGGVVRIDGPDGQTRVFSDSRITTNRGSVITYQVFQQNADTDHRAYFDEIQAW
jgi:hypothetical protein